MIQDITSIIALLMVIFGVYLEYKLNQKINTQLGESDYYKTLYNEFLLEIIPKALEEAKDDMLSQFTDSQNEKKSINIDGINEVIQKLVKRSSFTKFDDNDFYLQIEKVAMKIEDFCADIREEEFDASDAVKQLVMLELYISELYEIILTKNTHRRKNKKKERN